MTEQHQRMKAVNIQLTESVIAKLDEMNAGSRSDAVRVIISAVLNAWMRGDGEALDLCGDFAGKTAPKIRRVLEASGREVWKKAIVWLPESLNVDVTRASAHIGIKPADLLRGAVFGSFDYDPSNNLSREGHEFWAGDVVSNQDNKTA